MSWEHAKMLLVSENERKKSEEAFSEECSPSITPNGVSISFITAGGQEKERQGKLVLSWKKPRV